jgi:SAM-dependent methyltransferase
VGRARKLRAVIYPHPLAYLIGLEGVALLRAFGGEYDDEFTQARLDEIRKLLDSAGELGGAVAVPRISTTQGYAAWAEFYDAPGNDMIDIEQPVVREILDDLPPGLALDAACGTGRHSAYLASLGHTVIGVDSSPDMLELAREKVPEGEFREGDLNRLPVPDEHVDLVVCGLALMHLLDLEPAFAEFARVLRPGGHLVVSDGRAVIARTRMPVVNRDTDGTAGYMHASGWRTSDYLTAALPLGFEVMRCAEPLRPEPIVEEGETAPEIVPGEFTSVWDLHPRIPEAANAAYRDTPIAIVWHFRLGLGSGA